MFCWFYLILLYHFQHSVLSQDGPKISPGAQRVHHKKGENVNMICGLQRGTPPIKFEWFKDNQKLERSSAISIGVEELATLLTIKKVSSNDRGNYTCRAHNNYGSDLFATQLFVEGSPEWKVKPTNIVARPKVPVVLICESNGYPHPKIVWKKNEGSKWISLFETATSFRRTSDNTIEAGQLERGDEGIYGCEASNGIEPNLWTEFKIKLSGRYSLLNIIEI